MSQNPSIQIEKNVPVPDRRRFPPLPLDEMEIGDSFVLEISDHKGKLALGQRLYRFQIKNWPKKFGYTTIDDERVRIFRTKDAPKYKL